MAAVLTCLPALGIQAATVRYVKPTGAGDGSSWANACTLQYALDDATDDDEIWVAKGTYKPGTDRTDTFQLKNEVGLYGGFAGTETSREQRNWTTYVTTLSGDIDGDDEPDWANRDDNAYHVVTGSGTDDTAVLDGFTVRGGNAGEGYPDDRGGGMHNSRGSPTVTNCTFSDNEAGYSGGGMYNGWHSSPTVENCTFFDNEAVAGGGMYNFLNSSPTVTNCTFSDNEAESAGGGMGNWDNSNPTLENCTFSDNSADYNGGGMYNYLNSSPTVKNCTFSGNVAGLGGGMYNANSSPTVENCTFSGNSANEGGGMWNWINSSPTVENCTFSGNSANEGGGMYNYNSSPTVENCTFSGNEALGGGGMYNIYSSSPTVQNCTFSGNVAVWYGGGMCNRYRSHPTVQNCTFSGNEADHSGGGMYNWDNSSPTVQNCTFSGNEAERYGGGMCNHSNSSPTVENCTFSGNSAGSGGGMRNTESSSPMMQSCTFSGNVAVWYGGGMCNEVSSSPTVQNCTFSGNEASYYGGGMYNWDNSSPMMQSCTFSENSAIHGGGMYNSESSSPTVKNTILAENTEDDCGGVPPTSGGHNLESGTSCGCTEDTDQQSADPLLGDLQDNGGPTQTRALESGSPAIDAGSCDVLVLTDQRGEERPQGCRCDVGAYEVTSVSDLIVSKLGNGTVVDDRGCIDCGTTCTASYGGGALVGLTATPAADSLFAGWSGGASGSGLSVTVTMDAAKTVIATFTSRSPYTTGDVNGDSEIDLLDVRLCTQIAQGYITGTPSQRAAADVDGDGDVDADDVAILSEYVLGVRPTLP